MGRKMDSKLKIFISVILFSSINNAVTGVSPNMKDMKPLIDATLQCGRFIIKNGFDLVIAEIPILDPIHFDEYLLNLTNAYMKGNFVLNDFSFMELSDFTFDSTYSDHKLNFKFDLAIKLDTKYNGEGLLFGFIDIFGKGNADIDIEVNIVGDIDEDETVEHFHLAPSIVDINIEPSIRITGLLGDEHVSLVVGKQLDDIVKTAVLDYKKPVLDTIWRLLNLLLTNFKSFVQKETISLAVWILNTTCQL